MNSHQLEGLMRHLVGDAFCGVWASDQLPLLTQSFRLPASMIVNTHLGTNPESTGWRSLWRKTGPLPFLTLGFPPDFLHYPKSILQFF